mgnify:CR=1 FL=1
MEEKLQKDLSGLILEARNPYRRVFAEFMANKITTKELRRVILRDWIKKLAKFMHRPIDYYADLWLLQITLTRRETDYYWFSQCTEHCENQIERQQLFDYLDKILIDIRELKSTIEEKRKQEITTSKKEKKI